MGNTIHRILCFVCFGRFTNHRNFKGVLCLRNENKYRLLLKSLHLMGTEPTYYSLLLKFVIRRYTYKKVFIIYFEFYKMFECQVNIDFKLNIFTIRILSDL